MDLDLFADGSVAGQDDAHLVRVVLERLAQYYLAIGSLHSANSDRLDFHDVGVVGLRKALYAAYLMGKAVQHGSHQLTDSPMP